MKVEKSSSANFEEHANC